jgi:hypothetical protein
MEKVKALEPPNLQDTNVTASFTPAQMLAGDLAVAQITNDVSRIVRINAYIERLLLLIDLEPSEAVRAELLAGLQPAIQQAAGLIAQEILNMEATMSELETYGEGTVTSRNWARVRRLARLARASEALFAQVASGERTRPIVRSEEALRGVSQLEVLEDMETRARTDAERVAIRAEITNERALVARIPDEDSPEILAARMETTGGNEAVREEAENTSAMRAALRHTRGVVQQLNRAEDAAIEQDPDGPGIVPAAIPQLQPLANAARAVQRRRRARRPAPATSFGERNTERGRAARAARRSEERRVREIELAELRRREVLEESERQRIADLVRQRDIEEVQRIKDEEEALTEYLSTLAPSVSEMEVETITPDELEFLDRVERARFLAEVYENRIGEAERAAEGMDRVAQERVATRPLPLPLPLTRPTPEEAIAVATPPRSISQAVASGVITAGTQEALITGYENLLTKLRDDLRAAETQRDTYMSKYERLEVSMQTAGASYRDLQARELSLKENLGQAQARLAALSSTADFDKEERAKLIQQVSDIGAVHTRVLGERDQMRLQLTNIQGQLATANTMREQVEARTAAQVAEARAENERRRAELQAMTSRYEAQLEERARELVQKSEDIVRLRAEIQLRNADIEQRRNELQLAPTPEMVASLTADRDAALEQVRVLTATVARVEGEKEAIENQIDEMGEQMEVEVEAITGRSEIAIPDTILATFGRMAETPEKLREVIVESETRTRDRFARIERMLDEIYGLVGGLYDQTANSGSRTDDARDALLTYLQNTFRSLREEVLVPLSQRLGDMQATTTVRLDAIQTGINTLLARAEPAAPQSVTVSVPDPAALAEIQAVNTRLAAIEANVMARPATAPTAAAAPTLPTSVVGPVGLSQGSLATIQQMITAQAQASDGALQRAIDQQNILYERLLSRVNDLTSTPGADVLPTTTTTATVAAASAPPPPPPPGPPAPTPAAADSSGPVRLPLQIPPEWSYALSAIASNAVKQVIQEHVPDKYDLKSIVQQAMAQQLPQFVASAAPAAPAPSPPPPPQPIVIPAAPAQAPIIIHTQAAAPAPAPIPVPAAAPVAPQFVPVPTPVDMSAIKDTIRSEITAGLRNLPAPVVNVPNQPLPDFEGIVDRALRNLPDKPHVAAIDQDSLVQMICLCLENNLRKGITVLSPDTLDLIRAMLVVPVPVAPVPVATTTPTIIIHNHNDQQQTGDADCDSDSDGEGKGKKDEQPFVMDDTILAVIAAYYSRAELVEMIEDCAPGELSKAEKHGYVNKVAIVKLLYKHNPTCVEELAKQASIQRGPHKKLMRIKYVK